MGASGCFPQTPPNLRTGVVDEPEKWVNLEIVADHTEKQTFII